MTHRTVRPAGFIDAGLIADSTSGVGKIMAKTTHEPVYRGTSRTTRGGGVSRDSVAISLVTGCGGRMRRHGDISVISGGGGISPKTPQLRRVIEGDGGGGIRFSPRLSPVTSPLRGGGISRPIGAHQPL